MFYCISVRAVDFLRSLLSVANLFNCSRQIFHLCFRLRRTIEIYMNVGHVSF
jgi:hypothetical protein